MPDGSGPELAAAERARRIDAARRAGFYPLILLLERLLGERAQVGTAATPRQESIRFRHDPSLEFSASDVSAVRESLAPADPEDFAAERAAVVEVTTTFLGLAGAVSPLPHYLPEEVAQEDPGAPRLRDFLDLFHHRMLSLFHRARLRCDWPGSYRADQSDVWSRRALEILGRGPVGEGGGRAPTWRLLRWAPLLAERAVPAPALEAALEDVLARDLGGARVRIEELAGAWVEIAPEEQNRLGRSGSRLGRDLVVGRRIFDRAGKFRVVVGPLSRAAFARFGEREPLALVAETVRALVVEPLDCEVVLWLGPEAVPRLELSARGATRLGRNSWLAGRTAQARITVELPA